MLDIKGKKFNMLTAIRPTEKRNSEGIMWLCRCDCGNECYVSAKSLKSGNTKSCGCLKHRKIDITGQRFGRLTAIKPLWTEKRKSTIWLCRCDCGNEIKVPVSSLRYGNTKSCGCLYVDVIAPKGRKAKHIIDGTCIENLKSKKIPRNNTSGVKGVSKDKRSGKWISYITFKGKRYNLGYYWDIDDAAKARKSAEEKLHDSFVEWYESNKKEPE